MSLKFQEIIKDKDITNLERERHSTYHAKLNWEFHAKPLILEIAEKVNDVINKKLRDRIYITVLKEEADRVKTEKTIYGDSITIRFGKYPLPCKPTVLKPKVSMEVLVECGVSLVFSCSFNGSVIALIYPQTTDCSKPIRKAYAIAAWRNSREFSREDIFKIFKLFLQVHLFCSAYAPSKKAARIYAHLEAKHVQVTEGKNKLIGYFIFLKSFMQGLRKIYGLATP